MGIRATIETPSCNKYVEMCDLRAGVLAEIVKGPYRGNIVVRNQGFQRVISVTGDFSWSWGTDAVERLPRHFCRILEPGEKVVLEVEE